MPCASCARVPAVTKRQTPQKPKEQRKKISLFKLLHSRGWLTSVDARGRLGRVASAKGALVQHQHVCAVLQRRVRRRQTRQPASNHNDGRHAHSLLLKKTERCGKESILYLRPPKAHALDSNVPTLMASPVSPNKRQVSLFDSLPRHFPIPASSRTSPWCTHPVRALRTLLPTQLFFFFFFFFFSATRPKAQLEPVSPPVPRGRAPMQLSRSGALTHKHRRSDKKLNSLPLAPIRSNRGWSTVAIIFLSHAPADHVSFSFLAFAAGKQEKRDKNAGKSSTDRPVLVVACSRCLAMARRNDPLLARATFRGVVNFLGPGPVWRCEARILRGVSRRRVAEVSGQSCCERKKRKPCSAAESHKLARKGPS